MNWKDIGKVNIKRGLLITLLLVCLMACAHAVAQETDDGSSVYSSSEYYKLDILTTPLRKMIKMNGRFFMGKVNFITVVNEVDKVLTPLTKSQQETDKPMPGTSFIGLAHRERAQFGTYDFYWYSIAALVLVTISGSMSGLTVGYMAMDLLGLELKAKNGEGEERIMA